MTSDLEHDEIKDSSFPVEFNDETKSLDMYGVWVKKGPRDAPETAKKREVPSPKPDIFDSFETLPDLDDFEDLPDLIDNSEAVDEEEKKDEFQTEMITFEEIIPEKISIVVEKTNIVQFLDNSSQTNSDFSTIDVDDFFLPDETPTESLEESIAEIKPISGFTEEHTESEIFFDDILPEEINIIEDSTQIDETPQIDESIVQPDISAIVYEIPEDIDFSPEEFEIEEIIEKSGNILESEIDDLSKTSDTLPSDDDFSSFLDDLNTGAISDSSLGPQLHVASTKTDSIDLDSFIDSFNESGGASHDETQKIFDDLEPVDLVLEFDESFIEDAEKIRATGSSVSESEFFNSEFGVEMIDETVEIATSGDISSFIDTMPEMNQSDMDISDTEPKKAKYSTIIESNEFDDLLLSLDVAPSPAQSKSGQVSKEIKKNIYSLSVTEEDGFEALQPTITESASNDDIDVSLISLKSEIKKDESNEEIKVESIILPVIEKKTENEINLAGNDNEQPLMEEILDIPDIWDYNNTESVHDSENTVTTFMEDSVALDFDDISAVEQELSDMTPDTGDGAVVTNDKSTELLMIIADELSSIKNEITTLKSEISAFKNAGMNPEPVIKEDSEIIADNSGFFSDDDTDETIALTGDELNNILITADFTEEKNDETPENTEEISNKNFTIELNTTDDFSIPDSITSSDSENIVDFVPPALSPDVLADEHDIPETLPDSIFDIGQLNEVNKVEISHITTIEDDTSYLEGTEIAEPELDTIAIEEPELETIDFNDEKLEEPELTEFNIDLTEIETDFPESQDVTVPAELTTEETLSEQPVFDKPTPPVASELSKLPIELKNEIKSVLSYMDQLLESLPEEKIEEFARSEHFEVYKKLFEELGIS